ncbi:MAG: 6,7-dimethyl-8-ribityllumazine synthase [Dehalococcoidia bacterium]
MPEIEGSASGAGLRVAVIVARWNSFVTAKLLEGARSTLRECGVTEGDLTVAWVPGSFEVPLAAKWAAESGKFDAVICIGCVIRGETAHFEYVAGGAATGIGSVSLATGVPIVFGVLTTENVDQALARTGGTEGHKGEEAARTAIEMANLRRALA